MRDQKVGEAVTCPRFPRTKSDSWSVSSAAYKAGFGHGERSSLWLWFGLSPSPHFLLFLSPIKAGLGRGMR